MIKHSEIRKSQERILDIDALSNTRNCSRPDERYPPWIEKSRHEWGTERLSLPEWEDDHYDENTGENPHLNHRRSSGWHGTDLCHSAMSPVRVLEYWANFVNKPGSSKDTFDLNDNNDKNGVGTTLKGPVHFTSLAESHKGLCHGGSMCCIMDDVIGWCGFLSEGTVRPWSGVTAQINTSLKKPIKVNSILLLQATIVKRERRKVFIEASLVDPAVRDEKGDPTLHATGEGLVILNRSDDPNMEQIGNT